MFLLNYRAFAATIPRPFSVRYNPYTLCVEVIDSKDQIINLTKTIKGNNINNVSFCQHLASIVCCPLTFHILIISSETP